MYRDIKVDVNVKVCFMSAGEVNHEAIRELYPIIGCFIKKACYNRIFGKESKGRNGVIGTSHHIVVKSVIDSTESARYLRIRCD